MVTIERLPPDILFKILENIIDARTLLHCQAVCQLWRRQASSVRQLFIAYTSPSSAVGRHKLTTLSQMLEFFPHVQKLRVRLDTCPTDRGEPNIISNSNYGSTCMRYAEIGATVDKFVHVAAKSGVPPTCCCTRGNLAHAEVVTPSPPLLPSAPSSNESLYPHPSPSHARTPLCSVKMDLKRVPRPDNQSLWNWGPLLIFAIMCGFDGFREGILALLAKYPKLQSLLIADVRDSVTINLRPHHVSQIRRLGNLEITPRGRVAGSRKLEEMFEAVLHILGSDWPENEFPQPQRAGDPSPAFNISFWRAEKVTCDTCPQTSRQHTGTTGEDRTAIAAVAAPDGGGGEATGDIHIDMNKVSVCIATCNSVPLQPDEVADIESLYPGGVVLASLIDHLNKLSPTLKVL